MVAMNNPCRVALAAACIFLSPAGDALAGPSVDGCSTFPANNYWNTPVDGLPLHASSATWVNSIGTAAKLPWLVMPDGVKTGIGVYSGALYSTTGPAFNANPWDQSKVSVMQVGTATFTFSDISNGTFAYSVNGIAQTKAIMREVFATPTSVCN